MDIRALDQLEELYLEHHRGMSSSSKTIKHYQDTFQRWHRFLTENRLPLDTTALTTEGMQAFARWLRETPTKGCRGSTTRSIHGIHGNMKDLRAFVRWLTADGYIDHLVKVPVPKLPKELFPILSADEIGRVWDTSELTVEGRTSAGKPGKGERAARNRALMALFFDNGIRLSEAAGIMYEDLDLPNYGVVVTGKGNKQRRVPFGEGAAIELRAWIRVRGTAKGRLFWLSSYGIRQVFRRVQEEAGLPRFHCHQVRHQAATEMVRNKANIAIVQQILGHESILTTNRYLSMNDEDIREAHALASPFDKIRLNNVTNLVDGERRLKSKAC